MTDAERIRSLDVIRGFAVLGIFLMNIRNFALPIRQFDNPGFPSPPPTNGDLWCWSVANILFEDKMIGIFSMLFGAGIIVMTSRAMRPLVMHYRRMFWLLVIGLIHAFLMWYGDILNTYAVCGMVLFPFRRMKPSLLLATGLLVLSVAVGIRAAEPMSRTIWPPAASTPEQPEKESASDRIIRESMETEAAAYRGSWLDLVRWRAKLNIFWHYYGVIDFNFWRCAGFMLIGMGLVQLGVLSATRPTSLYVAMALGGYAIGLTMCLVGFWPQCSRVLSRTAPLAPESRAMFGLIAWTMRYFGAVALAIGHIGLLLLLCRAGELTLLLAPFAAAGRMALSNYLMQTVIAMAIFDGWACAQWSQWRFTEFTTLVVCVWVAQLILSPFWLRFFQFGPIEWAWRSLTYWKIQSMRRGAISDRIP